MMLMAADSFGENSAVEVVLMSVFHTRNHATN